MEVMGTAEEGEGGRTSASIVGLGRRREGGEFQREVLV